MRFTDFTFDGTYLSDFDMFAGKYNDTNNDNVFTGGDVTFTAVKVPGNDKQRFGGSSFDTPLSCTFDIIKNDNKTIEQDEYSSLMRWLVRPDGYHKISFCSDGFEDIYFNAQINATPIDVNNDHVGLHLTITTDSSFGYSAEVKKTFSFDGTNKLNFNDNSDKIGITYPYVKMTIFEAGNLSLANENYANNTTTVKNCTVNQVIEFKADKKGITGITNPNDFNFLFPVICNTYSNRKNSFTCNLQANIEIKYKYTRMVTVS